jgi:hypothetical protein
MRKSNKYLSHKLKKSLDASAKYHTTLLRNRAKEAGWPDHISGGLQISVHNSAYRVSYPKAFRSEILTLEYGTDVIPPSPVIRTFMSHVRGGSI